MKFKKGLTQLYIELDKLGPTISIPVRHSNKAKRISIKVNDKNAELVLPNKNKLDAGYKFLLNNESWIRKKLQTLQEVYVDNKVIPLFGNLHSLLHINATYTKIEIIHDVIHVYSPTNLYINTLIKFLQNKLLWEITKIVDLLNEQLKLPVKKIRIMDNKTRWGSCSSKAVLSFHWRLIFVPKEILHYVIVHEMCHLVEMNHSLAFWALVKNLYPDYQLARLWLKKNSRQLHQYCK